MTTIFDPGALVTLGRDLGDDAARQFATRYAAMLEERLRRLDDCVRSGEVEDAYAAALSLYSSSAMVGAQALARTAADVATALRHNTLEPAQYANAGLVVLAAQTREAMAQLEERRTDTGIAG